MMRPTFAPLLVLILVFQPNLATAQGASCQKPLRDIHIPGEIERFLANANLPDADVGAHPRTAEEELARLRARIRNLPAGAEIELVVRSGERFEGELAEANAHGFALWIKVESSGGINRIKKSLPYDEVDSIVLPEWNGWMPIGSVHDIEKGKKVEVLLVDGTKVKGRFSSATTEVLILDLGRGRTQEFSLDQVASVRKQGMHTATKVGIIAGAVFGGLLLVVLSAFRYGN